MTVKLQTDHEGRPVPDDESLDAVITVWEVSPHPGSSIAYLDMVERSWQDMLDYVRGTLDEFLERADKDDLCTTGVTLTFKLRKMQKREYLEDTATEY